MKIIIVGAGKLGHKLTESLAQERNNVTVLDVKEEALDHISATSDLMTVLGSGTELSALNAAEAARADLFIAVTSSDESNILACSLAKHLGCKRTIARIRNPAYGGQLKTFQEQFHIDYVANPELEMAKEISRYLLKGHSVPMENFAQGKVGMMDVRVRAAKGLAHKRLCELELPPCTLVAAILRDNDIIIPHGQTVLEAHDILHVIGKRASLEELTKERGLARHKHPVRRLAILGGGRAGFHLAQKLLQNQVAVKIIEQSRQRCEYLEEHLKGALVIHGDGTDRTLLQEESIHEMDALISATGIDEENLLLALLGKQMGIETVIAKVSRPNYVPIIEQLGIDLAVNPALIMASDILRFIQGGTVVSLAMLMQGQAEVLEIVAKKGAPIVGRPLSRLKLPRGVIIGAIVSENRVIVPDGQAIIEPDDRVVIFCLHEELPTLERLLHTGKRSLLNELWDRNSRPR